jgi:chromosome segregation ATPase
LEPLVGNKLVKATDYANYPVPPNSGEADRTTNFPGPNQATRSAARSSESQTAAQLILRPQEAKRRTVQVEYVAPQSPVPQKPAPVGELVVADDAPRRKAASKPKSIKDKIGQNRASQPSLRDVEEEINHWRREYQILEGNLRDFETKLGDAANATAEAEKAQATVRELEKQLKASRGLVQSMKKALKINEINFDHVQKMDELQKELDEAKSANGALKSDMELLKDQNSDLLDKLNKLHTAWKGLEHSSTREKADLAKNLSVARYQVQLLETAKSEMASQHALAMEQLRTQCKEMMRRQVNAQENSRREFNDAHAQWVQKLEARVKETEHWMDEQRDRAKAVRLEIEGL